MEKIRVLIVDDHAGVRRGLRELLAATHDIEVIGEATDGNEAVASTQELHPDVVLMDASMPGLDGIEATRRIVAAGERSRIVILSAFRHLEREARRAGAVSHLVKGLEPADLLRGIRLAVEDA